MYEITWFARLITFLNYLYSEAFNSAIYRYTSQNPLLSFAASCALSFAAISQTGLPVFLKAVFHQSAAHFRGPGSLKSKKSLKIALQQN
jgi:hypothetical protein